VGTTGQQRQRMEIRGGVAFAVDQSQSDLWDVG
jgi:hypothetical protein